MDTNFRDHNENTDSSVMEEPASLETEYRYAGFWMRFWAYVIDVIIVFSINGILLSPLMFVNEGIPLEMGFWTLNGILSGLVYYIYFLLMTKFFHQTVGKMILGIKVIREDEETLSWSDLFFREIIGRFIYNIISILKLLYLIIAFSPEKKGIHDMIGNTRVIHV